VVVLRLYFIFGIFVYFSYCTKTSAPTLPARETCPEGAVREREVGSVTFQTDVPVLEGGEMRT
ncbi:hypothetical protein WOLCODRAFT_27513, partial [Wolfiporia cocos MD-104 SS10]